MKAAIYLRQSLDKTGEGAAVDRQLAECQALADANRWQVSEVYRDNDASATKGARPDWTRLLIDLDAGRHDVLVCWHTDRLYRRLRDLVPLLEIAERRAIRIATVTAGGMDLSTPTGRFMAGQMAGVARYEVEQKGERQVSANRDRARRGISLWTRRPFGFERDGQAVTIVESEAAEIRKAADALLTGATLTSIAADLNARGVLTSLGNTWTIRTVRQVITNPRVAGRVVYRGEDMGAQGPAILDADTHERVVALLRDPRRKVAPSTAVKYLLSGIALCGRDGCELEPMLATTNGRTRVHVYRCRRCYLARHRERVDEVVLGTIAERLARPDAVRLLSPDVDVTALRAKVTELRERRDGLASLLAEGLLGADAVRVEARKLGQRVEALEREIRAAEGDSPVGGLIRADDVSDALAALPLLKVREVIRTLCDVVILPAGKGIRFTPEQIRIEWKSAAA